MSSEPLARPIKPAATASNARLLSSSASGEVRANRPSGCLADALTGRGAASRVGLAGALTDRPAPGVATPWASGGFAPTLASPGRDAASTDGTTEATGASATGATGAGG